MTVLFGLVRARFPNKPRQPTPTPAIFLLTVKPEAFKFRLVTIVAGLSACALLAWKHEGILKRINYQRAESHLENAIEAGENGDWKRSEQLALAAWQLKEGDPATLRHLYQSARMLRSRHLLYAAGALFDHPEATLDDRLDVISLYQEIGDLVTTKRLLTSLSPEELQTPDAMESGVRFHLARRDLLRALGLVEKLQQVRGTPEDTLLAAQVLARIPTEGNKSQKRAQAMIAELFFESEEPGIALDALLLLTSIPWDVWEPDLFADVRIRIASLQEQGQEISPAIDFLVTEIDLARNDGKRKPILDRAVRRYGADALPSLASWLIRIGESGRVVDLISPEVAGTSPDLYLLRVRALLTDEKWMAAQELLEQPHPQIPHTTVHSLRAVAFAGLAQNANARDQWERALRQASLLSGREGLMQLAHMASAAGANEVRNRALTEALQRPSLIPLPSADIGFLFSHLAKEDDPSNLLSISRNLLRAEPENPLLINNVTWLELVLEENSLTTNSQRIQALVDQFPDLTTLRATLALALLAEGKVVEAYETAEAMTELAVPDALSPTDLAVLEVARLRSESDSPKPVNVAEAIDWNSMMEVERTFFQSALLRDDTPEP